MRRMVLIGAVIIAATGLIIFSTAKTNTQSSKKPTQKTIPVEVVQLSDEKGKIPIEIKCDSAELSADSKLEELSCNIVNNTDKNIMAAVTAFSVTTDRGGITSTDTRMLITETLVHPGLREIRKASFIHPHGKSPINILPTDYENEIIIKVAIRMDYIEFEDSSGIGPNQTGSKTIGEIRNGAIKYRNWLLEKYEQNARSPEKIKELLQDNRVLMDTLNLRKNEYQGANIYRKYLNRIYEDSGIDGLNRNLLMNK